MKLRLLQVQTQGLVIFTVLPVNWVGKWHENPQPQWIIPLSGRWFVETTDGMRVEMGTGEISFGGDQNTNMLVVHFPLSIIYVFILAFFINRFGMEMSLTIGTIYGFLLYLINFYPMTAFFPWFQQGRGGINIFTHIVFGVVAAWVYKRSQNRERRQEIYQREERQERIEV